MDTESELTHEIVSAVARAEDVDPATVRPPLFESIDTEAMARLFRDTEGHLTFEYNGYVVTVSSDGEVVLEPLIT